MALMLTIGERFEVLRFLSAWRNWVLDGAPDRHLIFTRYRSLCVSARHGVRHGEFARGLPVWLGTMLIEDFDNEDNPFNPAMIGDEVNFQREISMSMAHLNTARRAWVDRKLMGTGFSVRCNRFNPAGARAMRHVDPFAKLSDYLTDPEEQTP